MYPDFDICDVNESVILPHVCPPVPMYTQVVFINLFKSTLDIVLASGGSTNPEKRRHLFKQSTLDVVLASGGSNNTGKDVLAYFSKVHPGHCACLRRFKQFLKVLFLAPPPWG